MRKIYKYIAIACLLIVESLLSIPLLASENWTKDIAFYRGQVFETDNSYSEAERQQAETILAALEENFADLSDPQIELELAKISALTNNGHSFLMPGGWTHRYARLPIDFHVFADGTFIILAEKDYQHLVGCRLLSLNGYPIEDLKAAWSDYQGGLAGWRDLYLPYFLETPAILRAAGLGDNADTTIVVLENSQGEIIETEIPATPDLPTLEGMDQYLVPSRLLVSANQKENQALPLYLQSPGQAFRFELLENPTTVYIQFKANVDFTGSQDINAFMDSVGGQLRNSTPKFIILDQRFNFGGDLNITRDLMQNLPEFLAEGGLVFVITSGRTFSAGISSVGYIKQTAPDQVIIVGEPIGDELEFWAEGDLQVLPDSGVAFLTATERHNYQTGCPEEDCHGSIQRHPIKVDSLQPDILAPLRYSDFALGNDPALDAIQAEILSRQ